MRKNIFIIWMALVLSLLLNSCSDNSSDKPTLMGTPTIVEDVSKDVSLEGPFIVKVSSALNTSEIDGVLIPLQEARVQTYGLHNAEVKIQIQTRNSVEVITPIDISEENQSIIFKVPKYVEDGEISLIENGKILSTLGYKIYNQQRPYVTNISPAVVTPGAEVTLTGLNLAGLETAYSREGNFSVSLTATSTIATFTVPLTARSGYVRLKGDKVETNSYYLNVKRGVSVEVEVPLSLNIQASDIAFVLATKEYVLDNSYSVQLNLDNKLSIIHATVEQDQEVFEYLYSAVILPDMKDVVIVNANSTAIAWIFMGMGPVALMTDIQLREFYDVVAKNNKVHELADYIVTLQKTNFDVWAAQNNTVMKEKYQIALKDVLERESSRINNAPARATTIDTSYVKISQNPTNENIYVNDLKYGYLYNTKLVNGSVTIVNDTMSYMSVEAHSTKNKEVVHGYQHITNIVNMNQASLISPKSGYLLGISSAKELKLKGEDSTLEIIIAAYNGETDKPKLSSILVTRTQIDGVLVPSLDMVLGALVDRSIPKENMFRNVISGMSDIYGAGFLVAFTTRATKKDATTTELIDTFVIKPIGQGMSSCLALPPGETCRTMISGIGHLMGYDRKFIEEKLWSFIIKNLMKRSIKRGATMLPVVGWIAGIASFVYDNMDYVKNTAMISETFIDLSTNPREINVDVDFKLKINEVSPMCMAIVPDFPSLSLMLKGEGFVVSRSISPEIFFLDQDGESSSPFDIVDNSYTNNEIFAVGRASDVGSKGSTTGHIFMEYDSSLSVMYPDSIRVVDQDDDVVYFDVIEPDRAIARTEVTLKGCGWLPLDDIKVYFNGTDGDVEANVTQKDVEQIVVQVPDNAKDGFVYVTAGLKRSKNIYFDVEEFGLYDNEDTVVSPGTEMILNGRGLEEVSKIVFLDAKDNKIELAYDNEIPSEGSLLVVTPTIALGPVDVYVERQDGLESNAIHFKRLPTAVLADQVSQGFEEQITVSLRQAEGAEIFYHRQGREYELYSEPITILSTDVSLAEGYILTTFARVVVDGKNYDSQERVYTYTPTSSQCPFTQDTTLHGYHTGTQSWLQATDTNGDGFFDDYLLCNYYGDTLTLAGELPYLQNKLHGIKRFFYRNGRLMSEGKYVEGKEEGTFISKYEDSTLESKSYYEDGKLEGLAISNYSSGRLRKEIMYKNGTYDGLYKSYYDQEEHPLWMKRTYLKGRLSGLDQKYYKNGNLEYEGTWLDSTSYRRTASGKDGVWTEFYEIGKRETVAMYRATRDADGVVTSFRDGPWLSFYENEKPKVITSYKPVADADGRVWSQYHGSYQSFYDSGNFNEVSTYVDGRYEGLVTNYYYSGAFHYKTNYLHGLKEGLKTTYNEDPNVRKTEYMYKNDMREGSYVSFYSTGETRESGFYHNDLKDGYFKGYDRDTGDVTRCSIYVADEYTGRCMTD